MSRNYRFILTLKKQEHCSNVSNQEIRGVEKKMKGRRSSYKLRTDFKSDINNTIDFPFTWNDDDFEDPNHVRFSFIL